MARLNSEINVTLKGIREFLQDLKQSNEEVRDLRKKIDKLDRKMKKMGKSHKKDMEEAAKAYEKQMTKAIKTVDKKANRLAKILSKAKETTKEFAFESLAVFTGGSLGEFASVITEGLTSIVEEGKATDKQLGQIARSAGKLKGSLSALGTSLLKTASGPITFFLNGLSNVIDTLGGTDAAIAKNKKTLKELRESFLEGFDSAIELEGDLKKVAITSLNEQIKLVNEKYGSQIELLTEASRQEDILAAKVNVRAVQSGEVAMSLEEQLQASIALVNAEQNRLNALDEIDKLLNEKKQQQAILERIKLEASYGGAVSRQQKLQRGREAADAKKRIAEINDIVAARQKGLEKVEETVEAQKNLFQGGPFPLEFLLTFVGTDPGDKEFIKKILEAFLKRNEGDDDLNINVTISKEAAATLKTFTDELEAFELKVAKARRAADEGRVAEANKLLKEARIIKKRAEKTVDEDVSKKIKAELDAEKIITEEKIKQLELTKEQLEEVKRITIVRPDEIADFGPTGESVINLKKYAELYERLLKDPNLKRFERAGGLFADVSDSEVFEEAFAALSIAEQELLADVAKAGTKAYNDANKKLIDEIRKRKGLFLSDLLFFADVEIANEKKKEEAKLKEIEAGLADRKAAIKKFDTENLKVLKEAGEKELEVAKSITEKSNAITEEAVKNNKKRITEFFNVGTNLGTLNLGDLDNILTNLEAELKTKIDKIEDDLVERAEDFNKVFGSTLLDPDQIKQGNIPDITSSIFSGLTDEQKEQAEVLINSLRSTYLQLSIERRSLNEKLLRQQEEAVQAFLQTVMQRNRRELEENKRALAENIQLQETNRIVISRVRKDFAKRAEAENRDLNEAEIAQLRTLYENQERLIKREEELLNKIKIEKYAEALIDLKDANFDIKAEEEKLATERIAIYNKVIKKALKLWDEYFNTINEEQKKQKEDEPDYNALAQELQQGFVNLLDAFINYQLTIAEAAAERVAEQLDFVEERLSETQSRINDLEADLEGKRSGRRDAVLRAIETEKQREKQLLEERKRLMKEQERLEKAAAEKRKVAAISQAVINGALAITNLWANNTLTYPFAAFYNGIQTAILAGITGFQIATIQAQQFREGGLLEGPSHENGGIPFTIAGRPGFEAEGGEFIVNRESTAMFLPLLQALNDRKSLGANTKFEEGGVLPDYDGLSNSFLGGQSRSLDALANIGQDNVYVDITEIENLLIKRARITGISRI